MEHTVVYVPRIGYEIKFYIEDEDISSSEFRNLNEDSQDNFARDLFKRKTDSLLNEDDELHIEII